MALENEFKHLKYGETHTEAFLNALERRVHRVENDRACPVADYLSRISIMNIAIAALKSKGVDAEAILRRPKLFFFEIDDSKRETWAVSETMALHLCSEHLGVALPSSVIDRLHRLGCFRKSITRSIIVRFLSFKDKECVLGSAYKIKGSGFPAREDYPPPIRFARRKLLEFAQTQKTRIKLRCDRLSISDKPFSFNQELKLFEYLTNNGMPAASSIKLKCGTHK